MSRVSIPTPQGTIKAKFMTAAILDTIEPIYPLQHSTVGVRTETESGHHRSYYCKLHREAASADAIEITLGEAAREVAWCKMCKTVLYLLPDDHEWLILRDRLCREHDYSQIEIYKEIIRDVRTHYLISFQRLVPGAIQTETMFPDGAFDVKDAQRDRREMWPNTLYVPDSIFDQELAKRASLTADSRTCCGYINAGKPDWRLCGTAMATTCYQCHRPICETHQENYTYYGDKEPTVICTCCRAEIHAAYGK